MYKTNNTRIVFSGTVLTFRAPRTDNYFVLVVNFVAEQDEHGRVSKGVRISTPQTRPGDRLPFPQGAQLHGAMGESFQPNDSYLLPKGHNSCSLTDTDGTNYELFKVQLVDQGEDAREVNKLAGGVLHFHATAAIPTELGGEGVLRENESHGLEGAG